MRTEEIAVTTDKVELRRSIRFRIRAAFVYTWENLGGGHYQGEGETRDIGRRGIYAWSRTSAPPLNGRGQLQVALPAIAATIPNHWSLLCEGRVIRVDPATNGEIGFAVCLESMILRLVGCNCRAERTLAGGDSHQRSGRTWG